MEYRSREAPRRDYDAVCVLGGGYNEDGTLPRWVHRRLELSHDLFIQQNPDCALLCIGRATQLRKPSLSDFALGGGTPHKPPVLDEGGYVLHESTLLAQHLLTQGIQAERILKESASYDTVGNAYFTLTTHAIPAQWRRLAIVTSEFHMPRTQSLFTDIFQLAQSAFYEECRLEFFAAVDDGALDPAALKARHEREAVSLATWKRNHIPLTTLSAFHKWLHETHQCYAVPRQHVFSSSNLTSHDRQSY